VATVLQASPYTGRTSGSGGPPDPGVFAEWYADYFVPRVTQWPRPKCRDGRSEGCPTTGGPADTISATAAIDWLNGRAKPITPTAAGSCDMEHRRIGMIGCRMTAPWPRPQRPPGARLRTIVAGVGNF